MSIQTKKMYLYRYGEFDFINSLIEQLPNPIFNCVPTSKALLIVRSSVSYLSHNSF